MRLSVLILALVTIVAFACNEKKKVKGQRLVADSPSKGKIYISVDETFRPVVDELIKVYQYSFPNAHIIPQYKTEAECLNDLLVDSIRMIIVTHGLKEEEVQYVYDSVGYRPSFNKVAFDAIAVIVNRQNPKEQFTMAELQELLEGKNKDGLYPVFDGQKATSTIRYAIDSILRGKKPAGNLAAANDSRGVIDFVSADPQAVGFVGISWIGNPEDSAQLRYLEKVKIAAVQCDTCINKPFILPVQKSIYNSQYPLLRPLVYMLKENYAGLGRGFANFMELERGQLIFRRAYLYPAHMPFQVRDIIIKK